MKSLIPCWKVKLISVPWNWFKTIISSFQSTSCTFLILCELIQLTYSRFERSFLDGTRSIVLFFILKMQDVNSRGIDCKSEYYSNSQPRDFVECHLFLSFFKCQSIVSNSFSSDLDYTPRLVELWVRGTHIYNTCQHFWKQ